MLTTEQRVDRSASYRALFVSDLHLGTRLCRAPPLATLLRGVDADVLYLVGDIVDLTRLRPYWTDAQRDVLAAIDAVRARGTRIVGIRGNHDGGVDHIHLTVEAVHETASGRRLLVTHGDRFDRVARMGGVASKIGGWSCDGLQWASDRVDQRCLRQGRPAIAAARRLKRRMKEITRYRDRFVAALTIEAGRRGLDGVISGHIHFPELTMRGGVLYGNCGDWIDNCTAIVEEQDGTLVLIRMDHSDPACGPWPEPRSRFQWGSAEAQGA